jgi:anthranilate/para-aminobenzoate synthase component II
MKILLINNHTRHLQSLSSALAGHDVEMQVYKPGLEFHHNDKDLVILSGGGGEGLEIYDFVKRGKLWYEDQMDFILRSEQPILGICMGFEVISSAFGQKLHYTPEITQGFHNVKSTLKGHRALKQSKLSQYESHYWHLHEAPRDFEVLADSSTGIEVIKHKTRPIFATQFHPEKGGTLELKQLLAAAI